MEQQRPQEEQLFPTEENTANEVSPAEFTQTEKPAKTPAERLEEVDAQLDQALEKPNTPDVQIHALRDEKTKLEQEIGISEDAQA